MELFHYIGRTHVGPEYLSDRDYDPLACIMLRDLANVKERYSEDEGRITQEEKNWVLCEVFGYSRTKAAKILKSLLTHNELLENDDGTFSVPPFDFKKQYVKVEKDVLQFFYDTFGKESMAFKAYCFLGIQWAAHINLRAYKGGFHFTLGGRSNISILKRLGYKSSSKEARDRLKTILDMLVNNQLISFFGPHDLKFGDRYINSVYTLNNWKGTLQPYSGESNIDIQETNNIPACSPTSHHVYRLNKFKKYYMADDDPNYGSLYDANGLEENMVVIAFYGMRDEDIIHLVRDFPISKNAPLGRIMFSTIEPEDDDDFTYD